MINYNYNHTRFNNNNLVIVFYCNTKGFNSNVYVERGCQYSYVCTNWKHVLSISSSNCHLYSTVVNHNISRFQSRR